MLKFTVLLDKDTARQWTLLLALLQLLPTANTKEEALSNCDRALEKIEVQMG